MTATAFAIWLVSGSAIAGCLAEAELYLLQVGQGFDCQTETGVCRGTFALGAPASRDAFERLRKRLGTCPDLRSATRDQGVNHPDFYDAWDFRIGDEALVLSIKDKSTLGATFVVLRRLP